MRKLAEQLRDAGLRVWFDEWVIRPGDDIYLAIERGLEAARVQVLCLSPAALGSEWVTLERSTVMFRDPTNAGRRFVPLMLADCTLPDTLRRYKYLDFREETPTALEELLSACRGETESPPTVPECKKQKETAKPKPPPLAVLERKLTGHEGLVYSLAFSPDGTWAISGSRDRTVRIWNLETGECQRRWSTRIECALSQSCRMESGFSPRLDTITFKFGMERIEGSSAAGKQARAACSRRPPCRTAVA